MWIGMCQVSWGIYYCRKKGFLFLRACWVTSVMSDYLWPYGLVACQGSLSMGFSGQEYWCGLPCPSPKAFVLAWLYFYYICVYLKSRWGFSRQEYWSGFPCPPSRDLSNPGIEPRSPTLLAESVPSEPLGKLRNTTMGILSLLQGIFLSQESNLCLLCLLQAGSLPVLYWQHLGSPVLVDSPSYIEINNSAFGASQVAVVAKNPTSSAGDTRCEFDPWVGKIPWKRACPHTPVFLPGESMGRGAWWVAVHGFGKSRTWLKQLSTYTGIQ